MLQIPELLAPAGDLERLRYAINYGADAVYCALPEFGMRSAPTNFTPEQLSEGVIYAHARGRKVYLTMNTLPTNEEADRLPQAIKDAAAAGVDAFIVADLGVLDACKTFAPDVDIHMSTQTGITNWAAARAAYNMGAKRVVLAREMTLQDIATLRDKTPPELEIEAFVHGAMCMSVSGRCLLSNYMAGRDANRGQCAQPCRWKYYLSEETRPGQLYEIGENENGSYILNANDMCTAPFLDLICNAGVDSLKIEGRAKTFYYVASVTAAYRRALDQYLADPMNENFELPEEVLAELTRTSHRHYSPGFYFGREQARQATDSATYIREWEFVGTVDGWENGVASCQQRGKWSLGDTLEVLCPDGRSIPLNPEWIKNVIQRMTGGFYRIFRLFRLDLQLLLAVDAAILAVGAQLEDLVALFLDGGDAAGVLAPHDVDQTLGGLGLFLLDGLAVLDDGHADVGVEIGQHVEVEPGCVALHLDDVLPARLCLVAAGVLDEGHTGGAVALDAQQVHQADGRACLDMVDDDTVLNFINVQHLSCPPFQPWGP